MIIKGKFASRCGAANNQSRSVDRHQTRHWKFAARSEKLGHGQQSLLDETIYADLAAIELELERLSLQPKAKDAPNKPRRTPFPANLPRADVHHEPELTLCDCGCELKRIGGHQREARLHAGRVHRRASRSWQMGVRPMRDPDPSAGASACH